MLNKIILVGRLTKDVESKDLDNGLKLVKFGLAINSKEDYCEYVDCVVNEYLQKAVCENLQKGDKIVVEGRFTNPSYTNKENVKRSYPTIYVENIEFIDVLKFSKPKEEPKPQATRRSR